MCVIAVVRKSENRPSAGMIEKMYAANDDGGGAAWREGEGANRHVCWKKGLEVEEMIEMAETLPVPYVMHFRIASIGVIHPKLTHPFPIDRNASLALEGKTKGYVLFHNGTWTDWDEKALIATLSSGGRIKLPGDLWSDSRAIAWLSAIHGKNLMDFMPKQKGVVFGPNGYEIFLGSGWSEVNGVQVSNNYFLNATTYTSTFCRNKTCTRKDFDETGYCPTHRHEAKKGTRPGTGGSQTVTPFPTAQGQIISLEVAERLHNQKDHNGNRLLSKGKFRRIKECLSRIALGGKKAEKAEVELLQLSQSLISSGLVH